MITIMWKYLLCGFDACKPVELSVKRQTNAVEIFSDYVEIINNFVEIISNYADIISNYVQMMSNYVEN